jgi:hypothetical protein
MSAGSEANHDPTEAAARSNQIAKMITDLTTRQNRVRESLRVARALLPRRRKS